MSSLPDPLLKKVGVWANKWAAHSCIILIGVVVFANSLSGPFIFDDDASIKDNPSILHLWPPTWLTQAWSPAQGTHGRIVVNLSLALNYRLGKFEVAGYHIFNIAVHILAALVLFGIVRHTLQSKRLASQYGHVSIHLALIISLIWLVHPLQTECVNYILQRSESIMGLFYLLTLYSTIRSNSKNTSPAWTYAAIIFCALGMMSKEVMVTAPIVVLLYNRAFYDESFQQTLQKRWSLYVGLAATWFMIIGLQWNQPHGETIGFTSQISHWDYLKNQCLVIVTYLKLALWPHPLLLDYGYPLSNLSLSDIAPSLLLLIPLLLLSFLGTKNNTPSGFLGSWFFIILGPTSSVIPIVNQVGADRRMYLPLAAVIAFIVLLSYTVLQRTSHSASKINMTALKQQVWRFGMPAIIIALAATSYRRNQDYRDTLTIWQTVLDIRPNSPRAHYNVAQTLLKTGHPEEAFSHFKNAASLDIVKNWLPKIHNNIGVAFFEKANYGEAIFHFQKTIELDPNHYEAQNNLGSAFMYTQQYQKAVVQFEKSLALEPGNEDVKENLNIAIELQKQAQGNP